MALSRVITAVGAIAALALFAFSPSDTSARLPGESAPSPRAASSAGRGEPGAAATAGLQGLPPGRNTDVKLANGALREAVSRLRSGRPPGKGVQAAGQKLRVEILHHLSEDGAEAAVRAAGGTIDGRVPGVLVEGLVPWQALEALEASPGIDYIRPPLNAAMPIYDPPPPSSGLTRALSAPLIGEEVAKTNADAWHAAGFTGAGVKVGIIDYFDGTLWASAQGAGEVPPPAGAFCRLYGSSCDIMNITPGQKHGTAVAEVIHEMAPAAQLFLAFVETTSDLQAAEDYFAAQGVDIISRSLTSQYDGPGNGTGPMAAVIDNAISDGMTWLNAAGNSAGLPIIGGGSYWRGGWSDPDADGWLDFAPGDRYLEFVCGGLLNGVRWSDWSSNATDYDVYVYDNAGDLSPISTSIDNQGIGAPPLETSFDCLPGSVDYLSIHKYADGNGTAGDVLEFMANLSGFEYWQNAYSASGPASDSASPGMLSVGAIDPALGTAIAGYSSWGPTNDDRTKPDLSAASCVSSYSYAPGCFNGTSAATPAAAGAAALVLDAGLASTPSELKTWLLNNATVDRGDAGADNVYGIGELILSAPPTPTPIPTPAPTPGPDAFGNVDCAGGINAVDALKVLRHIAGLPVSAAFGCTPIGTGAPYPQGDVDCSGVVTAMDALAILRYVVGLPYESPAGCPGIGYTPTPTPTPTPIPTATPTSTPTPAP